MGIKYFEGHTRKKVLKSGLWLHPCGFLGVSPDGIVDEESIIEVKWPFRFREIFEECLKNKTDYIVYFKN